MLPSSPPDAHKILFLFVFVFTLAEDLLSIHTLLIPGPVFPLTRSHTLGLGSKQPLSSICNNRNPPSAHPTKTMSFCAHRHFN